MSANTCKTDSARIFVDEFQDTDPLQAEILILLSADDPAENDWLKVDARARQSSSWWAIPSNPFTSSAAPTWCYTKASAQALAARGVARIHLTRSFRAVRPIQQLVNAAFAPEMTGDRRGRPGALCAARGTHAGLCRSSRPSWCCPRRRRMACSASATKASTPVCRAPSPAYIEWLANESGWQVRDPRMARACRCRPSIFACFSAASSNYGADTSRDYTQALEARGIPHLLVGSKSFYHREEVETVRVALAAIEWPDDELSVFGTLRGSLFAIPDDLLLRFRFEGAAVCIRFAAQADRRAGVRAHRAMPSPFWRTCIASATTAPLRIPSTRCSKPPARMPDSRCGAPDRRRWRTCIASAIWRALSK